MHVNIRCNIIFMSWRAFIQDKSFTANKTILILAN